MKHSTQRSQFVLFTLILTLLCGSWLAAHYSSSPAHAQEQRAPRIPDDKPAVPVFTSEAAAAPDQSDISLTSGTPVTSSLPAPAAGSCSVRLTPQYFIVVPGGATQLRITLSGDQDVDLFARVDNRLAVSGGRLTFDYKSDSFSNSEEIVVTASSSPALRAANYYIVVANCGTGTANFTLTATVTGGAVACPTVSNLSPGSGNVGSTVTLTGTNFTDVRAVSFSNNVPAQFNVVSPTQLTATVPAAAVSGPLTLSKLGCSDVQTAPFNVTGACPTISGLSPTSGAVGSSVVINGTNFPGVAAVRFANNLSASFTVLSDTQIAALVPGGAVNGVITISKPGCGEVQTPAFTVTPGTASELALDDGVFETGLGLSNGGDYYILNRLTPAGYPATLAAVSLYLTGLRAGDQLTLLLAPNPGGGATLGALTFTTYNVRVQALDQFNLYAVPGLTIATGDFLVGAKLTHAAGAFPAAVDQSPPSKQRSYRSLDGANFALIDNVNASFAGNFGVRARVVNTPAAQNCPTASGLNPASGAVGASVSITGTNFTGVSAVKFANNVTAQFTINSATQITATVPNGAVTGPLTLSKQGCTDVQTGVFTVINTVTSVPAGSFTGTTIAPDSIVAAFGMKLATAVKIATTTPLPTELEGTTVKVTDSMSAERLARLFFVAPTQINYLMPAEASTGTAKITVKSGDGTISVGTALISLAAPGLFTANANGQGVATGQALRVKANGMQVYEPIARFDSTQRRFVPEPIDLGNANEQVFLVLYGSGIRYRSSLSAVTITIGGLNHPALFAGTVEGLFGLDQVNAGPLSRSLMGRGEVDVVLTVDGKQASPVRAGFK